MTKWEDFVISAGCMDVCMYVDTVLDGAFISGVCANCCYMMFVCSRFPSPDHSRHRLPPQQMTGVALMSQFFSFLYKCFLSFVKISTCVLKIYLMYYTDRMVFVNYTHFCNQ